MNLEWHLSNRYLIAKKQQGTSLIAKIAIIGLILSIMTLITVLSVMNGFHKELRNRVLNAISHGYISSYSHLQLTDELSKKIKQNKDIVAFSPYIEKYALLSYDNHSAGVSIRGINPILSKKTSSILENISGKLDLSKNNIVIGEGLSMQLNAAIGDKITVVTPQSTSSIFGTMPILKRFVVSGIFNAGVSEYDNSLAFISINNAQILYKMPDEISGIRIKVDDLFLANKIIQEVVESIGSNQYYGVSWQEQKRNFIIALNLEKQMIGAVLSLIIAVAVFNIISMMIMVVNDKRTDIAILRTMGMNPSQIMRIFFYLGIKIGFLGIIIGGIFGILLSLNIGGIIHIIETLFSFKLFPEDVFYISGFPSQIKIADVLMVVSISFILVILSSIYPARTTKNINISQTIKEL